MQNSFKTSSSIEKKERKELKHIMIQTVLENPNKTWPQKMKEIKEIEKISKIEELAKY